MCARVESGGRKIVERKAIGASIRKKIIIGVSSMLSETGYVRALQASLCTCAC